MAGVSDDPFDRPDDDDIAPTRRPASAGLLRRPWWKRQPLTLAACLFAVLWLRELLGMPLASTWWLVAGVFAVWHVGPAIATGEPLFSGPVDLSRYRRGGHRRWRLSSATLCRLFAVLLAIGAVVEIGVNLVSLMSQYQPFNYGVYGGGGGWVWSAYLWTVFRQAVWSLGLALGLWTLGGLGGGLEVLDYRLARLEEGDDSDAGAPQSRLKPPNR